MADQGLFQSSQHSQILLAQRREIASDAAKGLSASRRAETAADLLLDLHHPDIALREAVGHASTLLACSLLCKPLVLLDSYSDSYSETLTCFCLL